MKNGIKKLLALFMVVTASFFSVTGITAFAADFPDVSASHKNYAAITALTQMGVIAGYDDGSFKPEREITRTEFCALMARTLGYNKDKYVLRPVPFSDVKQGYWGEGYISFCYETGLIDGMGDGTFAPAAKVTLEQTVKMAVCAIGKQEEALGIKGEKWYTGYAHIAGKYGLLTAIDRNFGENAARENVAQVVFNMIETGLVDAEKKDEELSPDGGGNSDSPENSDDSQNEQDSENAEDTGNTDDENTKEEGKIPPEIIAAYKEKDILNVKTILIDAGHNYDGKDRGAESKEYNVREEEITWQIADKLRNRLEKQGYKVIMTREKMTDSVANASVVESLQARVDMAHNALADLFISIHCNAGGGSGVETYCFSKNSYAGALAELIQENITESTELYDRGVKTANFFVIQNTLMPAILIETGFIDSSRDIEILTSDEGQSSIAAAVAEAVGIYDEMEEQDFGFLTEINERSGDTDGLSGEEMTGDAESIDEAGQEEEFDL